MYVFIYVSHVKCPCEVPKRHFTSIEILIHTCRYACMCVYGCGFNDI